MNDNIAAQAERVDFDDRLAFNLANLQRIDETVGRADSKSEIIAAANAGLFSILLGLAAIMSGGEGNALLGSTMAAIIIAAFVIYLSLSTLSIYFALSALFPHLSLQSTSLFYFGYISSLPGAERLQEIMDSASPDRLLDDIEVQVYANARIATLKFGRLRSAVRMLILSGVIWMAIMVALFVHLVNNVMG